MWMLGQLNVANTIRQETEPMLANVDIVLLILSLITLGSGLLCAAIVTFLWRHARAQGLLSSRDAVIKAEKQRALVGGYALSGMAVLWGINDLSHQLCFFHTSLPPINLAL
jgi:uncharacterized membrane-anchored protein